MTLAAGDIDANNVVNTDDLTPIISAFAQKAGDAGYQVKLDLDANGTINTDDLTPTISSFGQTAIVTDFADFNK